MACSRENNEEDRDSTELLREESLAKNFTIASAEAAVFIPCV